MSDKHEQLKQVAKRAIQEVAGDMSVKRPTVMESLDELAADCDMFLDGLRSDEDADREDHGGGDDSGD